MKRENIRIRMQKGIRFHAFWSFVSETLPEDLPSHAFHPRCSIWLIVSLEGWAVLVGEELHLNEMSPKQTIWFHCVSCTSWWSKGISEQAKLCSLDCRDTRVFKNMCWQIGYFLARGAFNRNSRMHLTRMWASLPEAREFIQPHTVCRVERTCVNYLWDLQYLC